MNNKKSMKLKEIKKQINSLIELSNNIRNNIESKVKQVLFYCCIICNKPLISAKETVPEPTSRAALTEGTDYDLIKQVLDEHNCNS